ncbi:MAG: phosphoribosylformylglycinamidine synthase subunit PurL, partial [Planctomycetia bacterium]
YDHHGVDRMIAQTVGERLLANAVIHAIHTEPYLPAAFVTGRPYTLVIREVPITRLSDAELEKLSREGHLFLSLEEMKAIQAEYRRLGREPREIELETLAQTWSEHCVHKTLKSTVRYRELSQDPAFEGQWSLVADAKSRPNHEVTADGTVTVKNLLKSTVAASTHELMKDGIDWCLSVFVDNSGVVAFDDTDAVCFKCETHNRPSAIEPYGGAATGIGGCIRDLIGTGRGATPIAATDVFCVAYPDVAEVPQGCLDPKRVLTQVVAGVRDYGNRMGIPTIAGAVAFDPGYTMNPLVFCGTVGIMPRNSADAAVQPGDLVVVAGGRTGRDGIHGATFSSEELSSASESQSGGSVQIGHAIHEKTLTDFVLEASRQRLFHAITDCGAGGLSSAVGEMGAKLGATVDLEKVPLKYDGLSATEVWISEAQERMVLAVPPADWEKLARIAADEGVEATAIGTFTGSGRLVLRWEGRTAGELDCHFLHEGRPKLRLKSRHVPPAVEPTAWQAGGPDDLAAALVDVLGLPDVASKEWIIRQYDHEVQGASVVKPLLGPGEGPADGTVIRGVLGRDRGIVLGVGIRHRLGWLDPYQMAAGAIVEAMANCIATGADPAKIALLDNFCWGDTRREDSLGTLVEACRGCHDTAIAFAAPFVSGKDSLNNVFAWTDAAGKQHEISIPPTLLATAMGQVDDVRRTVTPDLKQAGNRLAIVGLSRDDLAGSQLALTGRVRGGRVPPVDAAGIRAVFTAVAAAIKGGLIAACHDCSDGGLAAGVAEMALAGRLGARLELAKVPAEIREAAGAARDFAIAFTETPGRFLCEVPAAAADAFAKAVDGVAWAWVGDVIGNQSLEIATSGGSTAIAVERLDRAWRGERKES